MATAFTQYWKNTTWELQSESADNVLNHTASNAFLSQGVTTGDRLYIVTVQNGHLMLGGVLIVDELVPLKVAKARYGADVWDAKYYAIAHNPMPFRKNCRVPTPIIKRLRFSGDKPLVFKRGAVLDQQTLRGLRKLSPESDRLLDEFLKTGVIHDGARSKIKRGELYIPSSHSYGQEFREELSVLSDASLASTEKEALFMARRGQGAFRKAVSQREPKCRMTGIEDMNHLRASHILPWCESTNEQRLDGDNGLMLAPHIDHLFDKGYISFTDGGDLLISPECPLSVLQSWNIDPSMNVGQFRPRQLYYLAKHRELYKFASLQLAVQ